MKARPVDRRTFWRLNLIRETMASTIMVIGRVDDLVNRHSQLDERRRLHIVMDLGQIALNMRSITKELNRAYERENIPSAVRVKLSRVEKVAKGLEREADKLLNLVRAPGGKLLPMDHKKAIQILRKLRAIQKALMATDNYYQGVLRSAKSTTRKGLSPEGAVENRRIKEVRQWLRLAILEIRRVQQLMLDENHMGVRYTFRNIDNDLFRASQQLLKTRHNSKASALDKIAKELERWGKHYERTHDMDVRIPLTRFYRALQNIQLLMR